MWTFVWHGVYPAWVRSCVCVNTLTACMPFREKKKKKGAMFTCWMISSGLNVFSPPRLPVSILDTARREKQEATQGFLTSWPSDMIESVLLPSQTKGFWKQRVSSWLGLHVATDRGKREGTRERKRERERERERAIMSCTTFIYSNCPSAVWLKLGWHTAHTHTHTQTLLSSSFTHRHIVQKTRGS